MSYSENQMIEIPQKQLMADAREALTNKWGLAVGTMLLYMVVAMGGAIIPFASLLISGPLALGLAMFALKLSRNENAELSNIFDGFPHFVNALVAYLLMMIAVVIGMIFLIVPGIIAAFGLSQTWFILADNPEMSGMDALKKSWEIMDGHKMDYFVLVLRFLPWMFLCIFTLGIGFLWLMPYMQVTLAKFYDTLRYGYDNERGDDDISKHLVDG